MSTSILQAVEHGIGRTAVRLAAASSIAVVAAYAAGANATVIGTLGVAAFGVILAAGLHHEGPVLRAPLGRLADDFGPVVISAPKASEVAPGQTSHSDAA